jgi:CubicO group peptidase (beta-lactamase class C family)
MELKMFLPPKNHSLKQFVLCCAVVFITTISSAQMYFPPNTGATWDTLSPVKLEWCDEKINNLYQFLDSSSTKAFILLKDGKIVLEKYFNGHSASSNWYWASAGKTLTAFLVGLAQQENYLKITDTSSRYLGKSWTNCTQAQEDKISIWHQLTMTSGLDDGVTDPFCTADTCLNYKADAGIRWAYHNAPYTLLDSVLENATGRSLNTYTNQKVKTPTGMDGVYIKQGFNSVFFSTARSMARFGLLVLNKGNWNGNQILSDTNYYNDMVNTSQTLNKAYGYLWWLNGKSSFMVPQLQSVFNGSMAPNAPNDMISALGKNGQFINVITSQNMVWIRMGEAPDNSLVPFTFNNDIWAKLNDLKCNTSGVFDKNKAAYSFDLYPNPANDIIRFIPSDGFVPTRYEIRNSLGSVVATGFYSNKIGVTHIAEGFYTIKLFNEKQAKTIKFIKN